MNVKIKVINIIGLLLIRGKLFKIFVLFSVIFWLFIRCGLLDWFVLFVVVIEFNFGFIYRSIN